MTKYLRMLHKREHTSTSPHFLSCQNEHNFEYAHLEQQLESKLRLSLSLLGGHTHNKVEIRWEQKKFNTWREGRRGCLVGAVIIRRTTHPSSITTERLVLRPKETQSPDHTRLIILDPTPNERKSVHLHALMGTK